ncbi:MAG: response regulator [Verrucomicrobia bacterium]|jgi:DNA-binding NarL/FixJ family response regulator|nr:response regulator [Verrucomicrobiota bacterium]
MKRNGTILVIDDVPENLGVIFEVLSGAGYEVLVVENGEIALERMALLQPDLILLDVRLPGEDGFTVCRQLKASPASAEIPVIMMTGLNDTRDKVHGFKAGAVDYICKPVPADEVLVRVDTHLEIRRLRLRLQQRNHELLREVRRRREAERQLEESLDQAVLLVDEEGRPQFATKRAWDLIARFFPEAPLAGLPEPIHEWLHEKASPFRKFSFPQGSLHIQRFSGLSGTGSVLKLEEHLNVPSSEHLQALGLTPREAEILYWMAKGKTSPEIATILDSALNTVKKHAQRIYRKLEVENRTAAALRATELT